MLIFLSFILFWAFMNTDLFEALHDFVQFAYLSIGLAVGWISGHLSLKKVRTTLEKAKNIIRNPTIHIDRKYEEAVGAIDESCFYLGVVFEEYNRRQRTTPSLKKELETEKEKALEEVKQD